MILQLVIYQIILISKIIQDGSNGFKQQQALDADPKEIQQISFTGKLNQRGAATMFFIVEEAKPFQIFHKEL